MYSNQPLQKFFDELAPKRDEWVLQNQYYYDQLYWLHQWLVEKDRRVLDIGCGTGDLLHSVAPSDGVGIDFSHEMIKRAGKKYPQYDFQVMDAHHLTLEQKFDYILLSNLVGYVDDIWEVIVGVRWVCHQRSRLVITNYNYLWQPLMSLAESMKWKMPDRLQNWLPQKFIAHFLDLCGFEVIKQGKYMHVPVNIPVVSDTINRLSANLPIVDQLGLIEYIAARPIFLNENKPRSASVSVIVPTYQEAGNIEAIVERMPQIDSKTELLFVDLPGDDGTAEKIKEVIRTYRGDLQLKYIKQRKPTGKIGALRLGVKQAQGEIILIYDADMTVPPEDLQKFYAVLIESRAEVVNGTRLVYPTEKGAMRFLNHVANLFFAKAFTWVLGQHFTDTLCGSKGFWKSDFEAFEREKTDFDQADLFGDFYILLNAYRRNLKIAEVPVRYKVRRYGDTKIDRFKNGWQFLQVLVGFWWRYKVMRKVKI